MDHKMMFLGLEMSHNTVNKEGTKKIKELTMEFE